MFIVAALLGKLPEGAALGQQQLEGRVVLDHLPLIEDQHQVVESNSVEPMRDGEDRRVIFEVAPDHRLDLHVRLVVDACSCFVHQPDRRLPQQRPRHAQQLALARAQIRTPLGDLGVQAAEAGDLGVKRLARAAQAIPEQVVGHLVDGGEVVANRASENGRLLLDDRDPPAQLAKVDVAIVLAIDHDRASTGLDHAEEGHRQRALAGARPPHHAHALPRRYREREVTENRGGGARVLHLQPSELDLAVRGPRRCGRLASLGLLLQI
mmetsp:Transcript_6425/g.13074  ORF Transcript_6425/g.13074 Transcript_6425/m.13074 type:complete len:266 (+) Transcript_6425:418-1215(+)